MIIKVIVSVIACVLVGITCYMLFNDNRQIDMEHHVTPSMLR